MLYMFASWLFFGFAYFYFVLFVHVKRQRKVAVFIFACENNSCHRRAMRFNSNKQRFLGKMSLIYKTRTLCWCLRGILKSIKSMNIWGVFKVIVQVPEAAPNLFLHRDRTDDVRDWVISSLWQAQANQVIFKTPLKWDVIKIIAKNNWLINQTVSVFWVNKWTKSFHIYISLAGCSKVNIIQWLNKNSHCTAPTFRLHLLCHSVLTLCTFIILWL